MHERLLGAHGDLKAQLEGRLASSSHAEVSTKALSDRCVTLEAANGELLLGEGG